MRDVKRLMGHFLGMSVPLLLLGAEVCWSQALDPAPSVQPPRPPSSAKALGQLPLPSVVSSPTNRPVRPVMVPGAPALPPQQRPLPPARSLGAPSIPGASNPSLLVWDQEFKEATAKPGDTNTLITFHFTNVHTSEIVINAVRSSCGCTTVQLPAMPWHIPPGSNGQLTANLDLRGRRGVQTKSLMVESSLGYKSLLFKVLIPPELVTTTVNGSAMEQDRIRNMQVALMDRQALFKNQDCIQCHVDPVKGKLGQELFTAACSVCHDTPKRATIVPDLKTLTVPTSAPYWKYWIVNGRPGSLMPAFAEPRGGPLTEGQIKSLVDYLTETISSQARSAPGATPAATRPGSAPAVPSKAVAPGGAPSSSH